MLLRSHVLDLIRSGEVSLAFRRWRRPTVRRGGTLLTAAGLLEIRDVTRVERDAIALADAQRAGFESVSSLLAELDGRQEGDLYRIEFGSLSADPRIALRGDDELGAGEMARLSAKLARLDAGPDGAWTLRVLELIRDRPAVRAGDLCLAVGQERDRFKTNVRKLKQLGLTESLEVGYRLSPRGRAVLQALRSP